MEQQNNRENNVFGIPDSYFSNSAHAIRHRINCLDELRGLEKLIRLKDQNPFTVPEGYFEQNLTEQICRTILPETETGFNVQGDYFETSRKSILEMVESSHRKTKILPLITRRWRVAVAAALIVVAGLWLYYFTVPPPANDCMTMACLDRTELLESPAIENLSEEDLIQLIDAESLEEELFELPQSEKKPRETDQKEA